ncbi:hypothetical protein ACQ4LE_001728 [Meloidogyne hapla]|uniref:BZIP domain-containing protein n=1 Tax=Meloidogyne hapla TaxID=6305 RepID=A0A1I8B2K3_MELHA
MATPFTVEEQLVRRSLFGSLFNVAANKLHKSTPNQPTQPSRVVQENYDQCQQPCSSSSLYSPIPTPNEYQHHYRVYVDPATYFQNNPTSPVSPSIGQGSPASALGHQLDRLEIDFNGGFLENEQIQNNTHINTLKHQEEIYREIVSECRAFEQQPKDKGENYGDEIRLINNPNNVDKESAIINAALNSSIISPHIEPSQLNYLQEPKQLLFLPSNSPQQIINENSNNVVGLSLEHLVKVLVETVREVTGNATKNITNNNNEREINEEIRMDETAEQILERRRKQNNAAAARYRRRQRKVESTMQQELAILERRNYELRTSIANLKAEIDSENALLTAMKGGRNI